MQRKHHANLLAALLEFIVEQECIIPLSIYICNVQEVPHAPKYALVLKVHLFLHLVSCIVCMGGKATAAGLVACTRANCHRGLG